MSMPKLPEANPCLTKEQSLHMILSSIALEEVALSHILNAEGEKIQFAIANAVQCGDCDDEAFCRVLEVNESAKQVIGKIVDMQIVLKEKMNSAIDALPDFPTPLPPYCAPSGSCRPDPKPPCPPPPKPPVPPEPPRPCPPGPYPPKPHPPGPYPPGPYPPKPHPPEPYPHGPYPPKPHPPGSYPPGSYPPKPHPPGPYPPGPYSPKPYPPGHCAPDSCHRPPHPACEIPPGQHSFYYCYVYPENFSETGAAPPYTGGCDGLYPERP